MNVKNGLLALGARETDIITIKDVDFARIKQVFRDLQNDIYENA